VDDDFSGQITNQAFDLIRIEAFAPPHLTIFPPCHTGTVGVGSVAGVDG
jgi:hypothetical protein